MQIAICDNEAAQQNILLQLLKEYMIKHQIAYSVTVFNSGEDFLKSATEKKFDIAFLDIYMEKKNGITTAKELQNMQKTKIIFVTTSEDFAVEAFQLNAVHYLVKPIRTQDFEDALSRCFPLEDKVAIHTLKTTEGTICIREDHICFIEATGKYSLLYTIDSDSPYKCPYAFKQFVHGVKSEDFVQCHRSYFINLNFADHITGSEIHMKENQIIPISRTEKAFFMDSYKNYLFRQAKES